MNTLIQRQGEAARNNGVALIMTLIALSLLTLMGLTLMFVSTTDTMILYNKRAQISLSLAAESAIEEARDRMRGLLSSGALSATNPDKAVYLIANPSINPTGENAATNPYYDSAYSASVESLLLPAQWGKVGYSWVKIIPKTEVRAGYGLENSRPLRTAVIYYGFHRTRPDTPLSQYANTSGNAAYRTGNPVFLATAFARNQDGYQQMVQADLAAIPSPPLGAALYSRSTINLEGNSVQIAGDDEDLSQAINLPGIESQGEISGELSGILGSPVCAKAFSNFSYHIDSLIHSLSPPIGKDIEQVAPAISKLSDGSFSGNNLMMGMPPSAGDQPQTTFSSSNLSLANSTGQGILVVNGDLSLSGSFVFYGLIIVKGRIAFAGSGLPGIEIHGAVIANGTEASPVSTLAGNIRIVHNSTLIRKSFDQLGYIRLAIRREY